MVEVSLQELDLSKVIRKSYYPSPAAREDQVLYFLLLDCFSDGQECDYHDNAGQPMLNGTTPLYQAVYICGISTPRYETLSTYW